MFKAPFYGKGCAFPFRIDPATGSVVISEGRADGLPVALEYMSDILTVPEDIPERSNLIAEAICHILLVSQREYDVLPEFGSRAHYMLQEPNTDETQEEATVWFCEATKRWERRAWIEEPDGVEWNRTDRQRDANTVGVTLRPEFLKSQAPGNLVAPFVTARQARAQEFPLGDVDANGHDWASRYHGAETYEVNGERYIRFPKPRRIEPAADDVFYEVEHGDTWYRISWDMYGDVRHWHVIADCAVQDAADRGESRAAMDTCTDPEPGAVLRMPSRTRMLMELAA